jgi:hypothetical protein
MAEREHNPSGDFEEYWERRGRQARKEYWGDYMAVWNQLDIPELKGSGPDKLTLALTAFRRGYEPEWWTHPPVRNRGRRRNAFDLRGEMDTRRERMLRELASELANMVEAGDITDNEANEWYNRKADEWARGLS